MSNAKKGHFGYWNGKTHSEETKRKISKNNARYFLGKPRSEKTKQKISESNKGRLCPMEGKKHSEETKRKMRLSQLKWISKNKFNGGQVMPGYNFQGCEIINWYNMYYGFNFQHAENGGEVCIGGFYPDGVDQDKMIIIEIDEKHHFNTNGNYKQKDIDRQKHLEGLGYEFVRVII